MLKRILALILIISPLIMSDSVAQQVRYARITAMEGDVEIRQEQGSWQPAELGIILYEKDEIRTGKHSTVELSIDDGHTGRLEIKENTRLRLNMLKIETPTGEKTTLLDVAIGRVMIYVEKLQGDSKFEVNTPTSTMGVRGTVFEVVVEEGQ